MNKKLLKDLETDLAVLKGFSKQIDDFEEALTILSPDSHFYLSLGDDLVSQFIKNMREKYGDKADWIGWFVFENDYGEKGLEAGNKGKEKPVRTAKDLLKLIKN